MMTKRYLVIGNWIDKITGEPKSNLAEIKEGTNKAGAGYQITDTEQTIMINETLPVGTVKTFEMVAVVEPTKKTG